MQAHPSLGLHTPLVIVCCYSTGQHHRMAVTAQLLVKIQQVRVWQLR
jgi:hypothetical protein